MLDYMETYRRTDKKPFDNNSKTILGVMATMHHKATQKVLHGRKAGKTLVVAPKGIMSDWGKEIATHTNSKALYIGSGFKSDKKTEDGRKLWGQDGTEHEAVDFKKFAGGSHAGEDHDFHIVSYDTFMRNKDHFANSGEYDSIAIDEIHAFKNQTGKRGASLAETTDKFMNVWGLSGTPMENDAREIHSLSIPSSLHYGVEIHGDVDLVFEQYRS